MIHGHLLGTSVGKRRRIPGGEVKVQMHILLLPLVHGMLIPQGILASGQVYKQKDQQISKKLIESQPAQRARVQCIIERLDNILDSYFQS